MSRESIAPLLDAGEEAGCLNLSEFSAAVQEAELEDEELDTLYAEVEERGSASPTTAAGKRLPRPPTSTAISRPRRPTRSSSS